MADAIGQSLAFAVAVAISPMAIAGVVVLLASEHGRAKGAAFLLGWVAGIVVVGAIVLLLASGADASERGAPADWVSVLELALGAVLIGDAISGLA